MKRKMKILLALLTTLALLSPGGFALAAGSSQPTIPTGYVDAKGNFMGQVDCLPAAETMADGWYVSQGYTFGNRVEVSGDVNLILEDDDVLQADDGIHVADGGSLTIWAQSTGSSKGMLLAMYKNNDDLNAAIGGNGIYVGNDQFALGAYSGNITVNGGTVIAYGSEKAAGIGSGSGNDYTGTVTINGGKVTTTGGEYGAGIGSGCGGRISQDGRIDITGGEVSAAGGKHAACIGAGNKGVFEGTVEISGGEVTARAENNANTRAAGIGGGWYGTFETDGTVRITGGKVIAESGVGGAGIGSGYFSNSYGKIEITGGEVTAAAIGGEGLAGAGIGSGEDFYGTVIISGGTVAATGGTTYSGGGAGIGAGWGGGAEEGHIHINGGQVMAWGGKGAAGIGGGKETSGVSPLGGAGCNDVQITGGFVVAQSGEGSCSAIGHGENDKDYGRITFKNGLMVHAGRSEEEAFSNIPFTAGERQDACQYRGYARIEPCDHPLEPVMDSELKAIPFALITATTHLRGQCAYCGQVFSGEDHDFDDAGMCMVCGYQANGNRVSFDANGGTGEMEDMFIASGRALVLPDCLFTAPQGMTFSGWTIDGETFQAGEAVAVNGDMTAVARWYVPLTITLNPGDGTGEPVLVPTSLGKKYPLPACIDCNFTGPEWYLFKGWAVNGDETNLKQPLDIIEIADNTTVTAIWEWPTRTVACDLNGGSGGTSYQNVLNGECVSRPVDPTREGCTFKGWYPDPDDEETFDFATPITGDITLTAMWHSYWGELQERIDAAAENEVITLSGDVAAVADDAALTIPEGKSITLDLAGHTLSRGLTEAGENGNVITVKGSLTVNDSGTGGAITGGFNHGSGGCVIVANGGTLTLNGGAITGNIADGSNAMPASGGGVYIENGGSFILNGGAVTDNKTQMNVRNCHGGGVYVGGSFTMNGGTIGQNTVVTNGGGVYVADGTFAMNGGAISDGNWGYQGGGVYVAGGTFELTGGEITGNKATYYGGGVNFNGGTFRLSGAPVITSNTGRWDDANNLYLADGLTVTVVGALTGEQSIGVTMETPGPFTGGLSGNGKTANFASDDSSLMVVLTETGEMSLTQKSDFGTPDFTLPVDITLIEDYAFEGTDAHIVYIPDGCTEIGPYAFKDCRNLAQIRIPTGCAIGEFAFDGCENVYIFSVSGGGAEQYCEHHDNCTFVAE